MLESTSVITSAKGARGALPAFAFALVLAACLALAGCSSASTQAASSSSSASDASSESLSASDASASASASAGAASGAASASGEASAAALAFGENTGTALGIVFKNETGAEITEMSAMPTNGEGAPVVLMQAGEALPAGSEAACYLEPAGDGAFDLSFLVGGQQRQLHGVNFGLLSAASILAQDDVAYITTTIDGNPVSSLQDEYDRAHPPVAEEPAQEDGGNVDEPVYYYEEPAPAEPAPAEPAPAEQAPAQEEDGCVTDVILN